jgi:hypothetical protein
LTASSSLLVAAKPSISHVFFPFVSTLANGVSTKITWDHVQRMIDKDRNAEWAAQHQTALNAIEEAERVLLTDT